MMTTSERIYFTHIGLRYENSVGVEWMPSIHFVVYLLSLSKTKFEKHSVKQFRSKLNKTRTLENVLYCPLLVKI